MLTTSRGSRTRVHRTGSRRTGGRERNLEEAKPRRGPLRLDMSFVVAFVGFFCRRHQRRGAGRARLPWASSPGLRAAPLPAASRRAFRWRAASMTRSAPLPGARDGGQPASEWPLSVLPVDASGDDEHWPSANVGNIGVHDPRPRVAIPRAAGTHDDHHSAAVLAPVLFDHLEVPRRRHPGERARRLRTRDDELVLWRCRAAHGADESQCEARRAPHRIPRPPRALLRECGRRAVADVRG